MLEQPAQHQTFFYSLHFKLIYSCWLLTIWFSSIDYLNYASNKGEYGSKIFHNSFIIVLLPVKIWMRMKHCCTPKTRDNCVSHGFWEDPCIGVSFTQGNTIFPFTQGNNISTQRNTRGFVLELPPKSPKQPMKEGNPPHPFPTCRFASWSALFGHCRPALFRS